MRKISSLFFIHIPGKQVVSFAAIRVCLVFVFMLLLASQVVAATRYARVSGNWNNNNIWAATATGATGQSFPTNGDVVIINASISVTVNVASAALSMTVMGTLDLSGAFDLTMANSGNVTVSNGGSIIFGSGGQILGGGNNANGILVTINSGASLTTANTLGFTTGTGNTNLTGSIAIRPGNRGAPVYNANANYTFNGTAAQATGNAIVAANNITISNTTAAVTATSSITASGVVTINPSANLSLGATTLSLSGAGTPIVNSGTFTAGTSTVNYTNGSGATIAALNYYNLNGTGGNRTLSSTGTIGVASSFTPGSGTYTVSNSTVDFNGTGDQTIPAFTFYNLVVSNTGIKKILASITVACQTIDIGDNASVEVNADGGGRLDVMQ
jgi:hypothetical protein